MTYNEIIYMRIVALCKEEGISINFLGDVSGVGQSTLSSIKRGTSRNPTLKTIHRVANYFGMTPAEFLNYKEMNEFSFDEEPKE